MANNKNSTRYYETNFRKLKKKKIDYKRIWRI